VCVCVCVHARVGVVCVCGVYVCLPATYCVSRSSTQRILISFRKNVVTRNQPAFDFLVLFSFLKQFGGRTNF
jgi:hypothetical protein